MEKAREFVEKLYNDDEFARKVILESGIYKAKRGATEEEQKQQITDAANKLGYEISVEEYEAANKAYFESLGAWKSIKKAFHLIKTIKAIVKENA